MREWYALHVRTGKEEEIREYIELIFPDRDIHIFIPRRKIIERCKGKLHECIRALLPGYVLINTEIDTEFYYELKKVPNIIKLLRDEREPLPIKKEEMAVLLSLSRESDTIGISQVYKSGNEIKVISGPLVGMEGIIESFNHRKRRMRVRLSISGDIKNVDLGAELVERKESAVEKIKTKE